MGVRSELAPVIQNDPLFVSLTCIRESFVAFPMGTPQVCEWRSTSTIVVGLHTAREQAFPIPGSACSFFVEASCPSAFNRPIWSRERTSVGLAVHVGVGF